MRKLLIILSMFVLAPATIAVAVDVGDLAPGECAPEVIPGAPAEDPGDSPFLPPDDPERVEALKIAIVCERRSDDNAVHENFTIIFEDADLTDLYTALGVEPPADPDPIQIDPEPEPASSLP